MILRILFAALILAAAATIPALAAKCDAKDAHDRLNAALSSAKKGRDWDACALFSLGQLDVQIYCQSCQADKLEACMKTVSETELAMSKLKIRCANGKPL